MSNIYVKDSGGSWRQTQNLYANSGGTWRLIKKAFVNVNGTWQKVWGNTGSATYSASTASSFTFIVPPAVYSATFVLAGAGGGAGGGDGGYPRTAGNAGGLLTVTYSVMPGQQFKIYPGVGGGWGSSGAGIAGGTGGTNALGGNYTGGTGGRPGRSGSSGAGGGGGGATVITDVNGTILAVSPGGAGAYGAGSRGYGSTNPNIANGYVTIPDKNGLDHPGDGGGGGGGGGGNGVALGGVYGGQISSGTQKINGRFVSYTTWSANDVGGSFGNDGVSLVPAGASLVAHGANNGGALGANGGYGYVSVSY